ncbi:hypothetical protein CFAM422_001088 [Trichoderma lentiforme]|uniref:Uncharacterized protein n=1 Tax=Trichoderma lentiforme TaxID=1567552 RepID=A0A9P4XNB8_9HYPO|nr:hypothetical protein CFAM422_001088 [Trichoderma lentiforme]
MGLIRCPNALLVFWLIPLVQAYTVFETNCSAPATLSNYVSSPNTRGTLDILWSSLFTIFACTWTLQHPNIPAQRSNSRSGPAEHVKWMSAQWRRTQWRNAKWGLKSLYRNTLRMLWTVIAPELIMIAAFNDLMKAREICCKMRKYAEEDGVAWSSTHSYLANMGGFVIRYKPTEKQKHHNPYHLNGEYIYLLRQKGYIAKLPNMTEEEIKDKSKGDIFVKLIALGQIVWSTIQIIARAVRRLPVSPLEVAVVAFAISAVFIYGLYWNKPQQEGAMPTEVYALLEHKGTDPFFKAAFQEFLGDLGIDIDIKPPPGAPISLDSVPDEAGDWGMAGVMSVGAAVFGGVHAVAWNFAFPSTVELILWRCASIYTAAAPLCTMLLGYINVKLDSDSSIGNVFMSAFCIFSAFLYVIARLFILVEMFRTLCFLPPGSYISTWTTNMPHLA